MVAENNGTNNRNKKIMKLANFKEENNFNLKQVELEVKHKVQYTIMIKVERWDYNNDLIVLYTEVSMKLWKSVIYRKNIFIRTHLIT